jgi:hypothetical protein
MMTFTISDEKAAQYKAWSEEHRKTCGARPDMSMALYSFVFTPNGLGDGISVKCPCGERVFLDAGDEDL